MRWFLVMPGEQGDALYIDANDSLDVRNRTYADAGARESGSDSTRLSPHFEAFVYQWSVHEMPLNFWVIKRDTTFPLHGPVFIHKHNDIGDTVDMQPADVEKLRDYIALMRTGVQTDSWSYLG
jgi:hypothetical protein